MTMCVTYKMDEEGNPIECHDVKEWAEWLSTSDRHIKKDEIGNVFISTVFLGTPHGGLSSKTNYFYETMIFGGEHDQYTDRHPTKKIALMGHALACQMVEWSLSKNKE